MALRILVSLLMLSLLLPMATSSTAAGSPPCSIIAAPALVYALGGSVYRADPAGRHRCRLTPPMSAKEPRLAPDGQHLALLSGIGSNGYGAGAVNVVRVVRAGTPESSGLVVRTGRGVHRFLAWSPNGKALAFIGESGVWVWRVACRCSRVIVPQTRGQSIQSFVWSSDSRNLAAALVSTTTPQWDRLRLTIADMTNSRRHAVVIHFPTWLQGKGPYQEYPSKVIAWLPGGKLLLGTSGFGVGLWLTGIWTASAGGGTARMIVGVPKSPRLVLKFPLLNATDALVSPDGDKLLLDPGNRFWIASTSGRNGHLLDPRIQGSCALAQIAWVGTNHLVYVTVCTIGGTANFLARLYTLPLSAGKPKLLAAVRSPQQDQLSIAPPTRCIACGAG